MLQPGWEERVHNDGRVFFIDHSECACSYRAYLRRNFTWYIAMRRHANYAVGGSAVEQPTDRRTGSALLARLQAQVSVLHVAPAKAFRLAAPIAWQSVRNVGELLAAQFAGNNTKLEVYVRRQHVLEDTYRALRTIPHERLDLLKTKLWITFEGEVSTQHIQ